MCVNIVCPTCSPHVLPYALVVCVEPREQLQLTGWVDVTGQRQCVERGDFLHASSAEGVVQIAPGYTTQYQRLGVCRAMVSKSILKTLNIREGMKEFFTLNICSNTSVQDRLLRDS